MSFSRSRADVMEDVRLSDLGTRKCLSPGGDISIAMVVVVPTSWQDSMAP
jgi:hypothetical protein